MQLHAMATFLLMLLATSYPAMVNAAPAADSQQPRNLSTNIVTDAVNVSQ